MSVIPRRDGPSVYSSGCELHECDSLRGGPGAQEDPSMSPRLLRIDAMVFRADSVRFEACPTFRGGADAELCECGWLEADHAPPVASRRRMPRRRSRAVAVARAS